MVATPLYSHVTRAPYDGFVYEPAEDTFALLDALEQDADELRRTKPALVVEIGSGSGCVSAFVAAILEGDGKGDSAPSQPTPAKRSVAPAPSAAFICTDINVKALEATCQTARLNDHSDMNVVQTSLVEGLLPRCKGKIDVLLFNPPYVPTTEEEEQAAQSLASIEGSWAGGQLGTRLLELLLPDIANLLSPSGRFYLVTIKQNDPDELVRRMNEGGLLRADICLSRRAGREHLCIVRAVRI